MDAGDALQSDDLNELWEERAPEPEHDTEEQLDWVDTDYDKFRASGYNREFGRDPKTGEKLEIETNLESEDPVGFKKTDFESELKPAFEGRTAHQEAKRAKKTLEWAERNLGSQAKPAHPQ